MGKIFVIFLLVFLVIFLANCVKNFEKIDEISIGNGKEFIRINVKIADDNEERAKGLMFRKYLNENDGMLFVFDEENYQTFWMKNTLIPLDIIFIDEKFEIVDIKNAVPCKEEPCELYKSLAPAKFALEVNSNFTAKNKIKIGDMIALG